jgi:hypothetical protein
MGSGASTDALNKPLDFFCRAGRHGGVLPAEVPFSEMYSEVAICSQ